MRVRQTQGAWSRRSRRNVYMRCVLSSLVVALATCLVAVQAADPVKPPSPDKVKTGTGDTGTTKTINPLDLELEQRQLKNQFLEFKQALLRLAQHMENSAKQEDRDKAVLLKKAIASASEKGTDAKFMELIDLLRKDTTFKDLEAINQAVKVN